MKKNQTDRTDNLVIALEAALNESRIPFYIYDASFFSGEGILEGDWLVIARSLESEDAIVIETITRGQPTLTLSGTRNIPVKQHKIYYPFYDEGDASVGMADAWIIDFDVEKPDYLTDSIVEASLHTVNWFLNREIRMRIDNALTAQEFQANYNINPKEE